MTRLRCCFCESGVALAPNAAVGGDKHSLDPVKKADSNDITYAAGALLSLLEMLALDAYRHDVFWRTKNAE